MSNEVYLFKTNEYNAEEIYKLLPDKIFNIINSGNTIVLKPNWIRQSHLYRDNEWEYIITHPTVVTAVLKKVVDRLSNRGKVIITDGPETASSMKKILSHYPTKLWKEIALKNNIELEIIDLRDDEWISDGNVIIERKKLKGDPKGSAEVNLLKEKSEFFGHIKSHKGYYGASSDISETNKAHDGNNNLYRVSTSVLEADVLINLPKLKTHKKAGITCCLKNIVGINTYKNFLPHNSIGTYPDGGDQFPEKNISSRTESTLMPIIHQYILKNPRFAKLFSPIMKLGKIIFGDNRQTIRGGAWYGNDTLWRTILDLNKILLYAEPNGEIKEDLWKNKKKYIGIVDGILCGEGEGPKSPDLINMGYLFCGTNPVTIDAVCSRLMGFDPLKIPSISNAFNIRNLKIVNFNYKEIKVFVNNAEYFLNNISKDCIVNFKPSAGWKEHIEHK